MPLFLFYFFSALSVLSALAVVLLKKPARALLSLVVTMASLSVLYVLLEAPLLAMINLIVYAGAVLVLFLFVIMLLGIGAEDEPLNKRFSFTHLVTVTAAILTLLGILIYVFNAGAGLQKSGGHELSAESLQGHKPFHSPLMKRIVSHAPPQEIVSPGEADTIGLEIFTGWLLPFELTSLLLLLGIFAATSLAKKDETPKTNSGRSPERFMSKEEE